MKRKPLHQPGVGSLDKVRLARAVRDCTRLTYAESLDAVDAFIVIVREQLRMGGSVVLRDFFNFDVVERKQKTVRNPQTQELMTVPGGRNARVRVSKYVKEMMDDVD